MVAVEQWWWRGRVGSEAGDVIERAMLLPYAARAARARALLFDTLREVLRHTPFIVFKMHA